MSNSIDYKTKINVDGKEIETLAGILPEIPKLEILFIAKCLCKGMCECWFNRNIIRFCSKKRYT